MNEYVVCRSGWGGIRYLMNPAALFGGWTEYECRAMVFDTLGEAAAYANAFSGAYVREKLTGR